jgi:hypothetical protein
MSTLFILSPIEFLLLAYVISFAANKINFKMLNVFYTKTTSTKMWKILFRKFQTWRWFAFKAIKRANALLWSCNTAYSALSTLHTIKYHMFVSYSLQNVDSSAIMLYFYTKVLKAWHSPDFPFRFPFGMTPSRIPNRSKMYT